jgi:RNA polymerase sigma-70 factor (ECF subfamily)
MADASDDALLAAMAAGDGEAATAFVRRYQRRVFGVAYSVLGDRGRADDVAQEAFAKAWRHGTTFDARRGSVTTWLLTITRNLAIDTLRSQRLRPVDHLEELELRLVSSAPDPSRAALADDDRSRVLAALRAMPVEQRRAVVITGLAGRTARELGEIDGIPLGTAKTRVRTGLRRLREVLDEERVQP